MHISNSISAVILLSLAFYFGFVLNEVTYDEARDEGLQEIRYSPAPGNQTEKSFVFHLNIIALQSDFGMLSSIICSCICCLVTADRTDISLIGDINFLGGQYFYFNPNDAPENRTVTFNVIRDNVVEGQEIGQLQIHHSAAFDGFAPLFQNVRIIINDFNSELYLLLLCIASYLYIYHIEAACCMNEQTDNKALASTFKLSN